MTARPVMCWPDPVYKCGGLDSEPTVGTCCADRKSIARGEALEWEASYPGSAGGRRTVRNFGRTRACAPNLGDDRAIGSP